MIFRVLAPLTVVLFSWTAAVSVQAQRSTGTSFDLDKFVNAEGLALQLPGLAAVVVRSDGAPRVYVSGERHIGKGDPIPELSPKIQPSYRTVSGSSYRQLVQELVFARLGGHAAFGNPGLASEPQPWA